MLYYKHFKTNFYYHIPRIYEDGLKSLYDDVISTVEDFLITEIQTLQHHWKKCVNSKDKYVEKYISFGHNPWKYFR